MFHFLNRSHFRVLKIILLIDKMSTCCTMTQLGCNEMSYFNIQASSILAESKKRNKHRSTSSLLKKYGSRPKSNQEQGTCNLKLKVVQYYLLHGCLNVVYYYFMLDINPGCKFYTMVFSEVKIV